VLAIILMVLFWTLKTLCFLLNFPRKFIQRDKVEITKINQF
jgi:hypothetical protein